MAGEQKGKAYEAFIKASLSELKTRRVFKGDIYWDEKAEGMTIVPDLTIGADKDHPHTVILVTHSGSAKNSDMKYWRNMGELAETKILLPTAPKVFNVAFDSVIKENLKKAQAASFDGQLLVGDQKYGTQLQKWIDDNLPRVPKDKHEKVDFLQKEVKTDKILKVLMANLTADLEALLKKSAPVELDKIWAMERSRSAGRAPRARDTFVRRGLSKILIFEDPDVAVRLFSGKRVKSDEIPDYVYELALATKFTAGGSGIAKPADEEISNAVATLGESVARKIVAKAPIDKVEAWLVTLKNITDLAVMGKYVVDQFGDVAGKSKLILNLKKLHNDPLSLVHSKDFSGGAPQNVWLFEILIEVIKQYEGEASGYGYAQLGREVIDAGYGTVKDLASANQFGGGFGLSAWIKRDPKSGFRNELLEGCAHVISQRISSIGKSRVKSIINGIKTGYSSNIIESKLCTYKGFEPLRLLIESSVSGTKLEAVRSCFGEKADLPGQATKTTVLRKQKTLINWQSASDAGRDHKKKELCGRAVSLRYSWDVKSKKFIKRPNVEKMILLLDGTWRREDLLALARAGWDEIFYSDEMDKLAKAIV